MAAAARRARHARARPSGSRPRCPCWPPAPSMLDLPERLSVFGADPVRPGPSPRAGRAGRATATCTCGCRTPRRRCGSGSPTRSPPSRQPQRRVEDHSRGRGPAPAARLPRPRLRASCSCCWRATDADPVDALPPAGGRRRDPRPCSAGCRPTSRADQPPGRSTERPRSTRRTAASPCTPRTGRIARSRCCASCWSGCWPTTRRSSRATSS